MRLLLESGADPNSNWHNTQYDQAESALYGTVEANSVASARLLLEAGADPNDNESLYHACENNERAIDAISIPTSDDAREVKRLDSLASLTEQQTRDLRRRTDLKDQLAKSQAGAPDRQTIRKAIKNLEGLWGHLTMGERD